MAIDSETIDAVPINSEAIDAVSIGTPEISLTDKALCILNDSETTMVFSEGTWNVFDNVIASRGVVNPGNVATGWTVANTAYSENGLSLASLPFYSAGVYALPRCSISAAVSFTLTISGLNDAASYTFIFSGATSSTTGAGTREMTITSDVSASTAIILTDPGDTDNDHIDSIDLQSPSSGTIVLTCTNTGPTQSVQCSTFEIQEFS